MNAVRIVIDRLRRNADEAQLETEIQQTVLDRPPDLVYTSSYEHLMAHSIASIAQAVSNLRPGDKLLIERHDPRLLVGQPLFTLTLTDRLPESE